MNQHVEFPGAGGARSGARIMKGLVVGLLCLAAAAWAGDSAKRDTAGLKWRRESGSVALYSGAAPVWKFSYGPDTVFPKFHPVALPGGPVLTADSPPDHHWHYGFWFAWMYLNKLNYWYPVDQKTGRFEGVAKWRSVKTRLGKDFSAHIGLVVEYSPSGQPPVLREERRITVSAPDPSGQYYFDWMGAFTPVGSAVVLDRVPIAGEPEGKDWGGFAGLSFRFATDFTDWAVAFANGQTGVAPTGRRDVAIDYNGMAGGREAGVAFLEGPGNLNSPTPWHLPIVGGPKTPAAFAQPAVLYYGPHTIQKGETLRLRYRVIVHPGRWDSRKVKAEYTKFIGSGEGTR